MQANQSNSFEGWNLLIQSAVALGTLAVAILAIWGDKIRDKFAGPRITLGLADPKGDLTNRQNGVRTIYYHLRVANARTWAPSRQTRVLCTGIAKRLPDGSFLAVPLAVPVQFNWPFPQFREIAPDIRSGDVCDFGFLDEEKGRFSLALYVYPNNFQGYVLANEAMRVSVVVSSNNFHSANPHAFEVAWDGKWDADLEKMRRHLVIKEVPGKADAQ